MQHGIPNSTGQASPHIRKEEIMSRKEMGI
jgi:hypothetical protein